MNNCNICNRQFEDKYFDAEQNKCILHYEKDNWFTLNENNKKIWDDAKVNLFWKFIQDKLDDIYLSSLDDEIDKEYKFVKVVFPSFQKEIVYYSIADNTDALKANFYSFGEFKHPNGKKMQEQNTIFNELNIEFRECIFLDIANFEKYNLEENIIFNTCTFKDALLLNKVYKRRVSFLACTINNSNCKDIIFEEKVEIKECTLNNSDFENTRFKKVCDFYKTKFYDNNFNKTTFEDIAVFTETVFYNDVNFKYTTFEKLALFRKTIFEKTVNFEDSIFNEETNFLDIKLNMANRETARIIKNSFEQQNNIIEANRFYAKEMEERENELKFLDNPFQWLVFKAHSKSSSHSQDWVLPILWILNIGLFYSMNISTFYHNNALASIAGILIILFFVFCKTTLLKIMLSTSFIIFIFLSYIDLDDLADKINPFSIMTSKDPITFGLLIFKITIAYLIYQFIVSVRQNTRRK